MTTSNETENIEPTTTTPGAPLNPKNILLLLATVFCGSTAAVVTGDWRVDILIAVTAFCGLLWRNLPDADKNRVPDVVELAGQSAYQRVMRWLRGGAAPLLLATGVGISAAGCAHWSLDLTDARIAANGSGEAVWNVDAGTTITSGFVAEASASGQICRNNACVPVGTDLSGGADPGLAFRACVRAWRLALCPVDLREE